MIQKQIIASPLLSGILPDANLSTIIYTNIGAGTNTAYGRRIVKFDISKFKINYFKLLSVRLQTDFATGAAPPFNDGYAANTFLEIEKVLLQKISGANKFFCIDKNLPLELEPDYYTCFVFLNDFQDTAFNITATTFENELDFDTVTGTTRRKIGGVKIHHLPDHFYSADLVHYHYSKLPTITANVEMELLSKTQKEKIIPDNIY